MIWKILEKIILHMGVGWGGGRKLCVRYERTIKDFCDYCYFAFMLQKTSQLSHKMDKASFMLFIVLSLYDSSRFFNYLVSKIFN